VWEVGWGVHRRWTFAPFNAQNPHPALPEGEGALFDVRCKLQALYRLRTISTSYRLQATSHKPRASFLPPPPGEVAAKPPEGGRLGRRSQTKSPRH